MPWESLPNVPKLSCGARPAKRAVRAAHLAAVIPTMACAARTGHGRRPWPTSVSFNGLLGSAPQDYGETTSIAEVVPMPSQSGRFQPACCQFCEPRRVDYQSPCKHVTCSSCRRPGGAETCR